MKKIFSRIAIGAIVGVGIGFIISIIFSAIKGNGDFLATTPEFLSKFDKEVDAVIVSTILYALIGIISSLSSMIYDVKNEKGNLFLKTIIHFIIIIVTLMIIGSYLTWYEFSALSIMIFILLAVAIYFIIWTVIYFIKKDEIRRINQKIKRS